MLHGWYISSNQGLSFVGDNWLGTLNTSKSQLVSFHYHRAELEFSPVFMNCCSLKWSPCFYTSTGAQDHQLSHKVLTYTINRQRCCRNSWFLVRLQKVTDSSWSPFILFLFFYKNQTRRKREYCCHIELPNLNVSASTRFGNLLLGFVLYNVLFSTH